MFEISNQESEQLGLECVLFQLQAFKATLDTHGILLELMDQNIGEKRGLNWRHLFPLVREQRWKLIALLIVLAKASCLFSFLPADNLIWKQLFDS